MRFPAGKAYLWVKWTKNTPSAGEGVFRTEGAQNALSFTEHVFSPGRLHQDLAREPRWSVGSCPFTAAATGGPLVSSFPCPAPLFSAEAEQGRGQAGDRAVEGGGAANPAAS